MRTTLTLDDDLAEKMKELAHERGQPFRRIVNDLIRRGLWGGGRRREEEPFRVETFRSALRPGIDPLRLNQLVDELEVTRGARRSRR